MVGLTFPLKNPNKLLPQIPLLLGCKYVTGSTIQMHLCETFRKSYLRKQPGHWEFIFARTSDSRGSTFLDLSVVRQLADCGRVCFVLRSVMAAAPSPGKFSGVVLTVIPRISV